MRGRLGGRGEYVKLMIDSGNTVGDLVSDEFAQWLGPDGDEVRRRHRHHRPGGQEVPGDHRQTGRDRWRFHHVAIGGEGPNASSEPVAALSGPPLVQPGFRRGMHTAGGVWGSQYSWWADRPAEHKGPVREGGLVGQEGCRH